MILSGFAGYGKHAELEKIPDDLKPKTLLLFHNEDHRLLLQKIKTSGIQYPCIAKPDLGRTGRAVQKIHNEKELLTYYDGLNEPLVVQEFIDYPLEFGIFYYRLPSEEKGHITGIVEKQFMFLEGNEIHTFEQLLLDHPRAKYYYHQMKKEYSTQWNEIYPKGKKIQLGYIGNHCR